MKAFIKIVRYIKWRYPNMCKCEKRWEVDYLLRHYYI